MARRIDDLSTKADVIHTHPVTDIEATGVASDTTYLRGDGTWDAVEAGGGGAVDSVNAQTGAVVLDADDIDDAATTHKFVAAGDITKLSNLSGTNTGDQDLSGYSLTSHNHDAAYAALAHGHVIADTTGLQAALDAKAATAHTHSTTDLTATGGTSTSFLRKDNTWATPTDTNTTYTEISEAEITTGTATTTRSISGRRAQFIVTKAQTGMAATSHTHVATTDLTATGTKDNTTFLRGDDTWATPAGGGGGVTDHTALTNIGTNTHAQIDTHIASTSNPHSVTKAQVGLSNVPNTDFTAAVAANTAKISFDSTASTKLAGIAAGAEVNVQSDWSAASGDAFILNKPTLGTAAAMASTAFATAAQGAKADTAVQPAGLTKAAVGLGNVDNTSDASKPVSTATQTALNLKADTTAVYTQAQVNAMFALRKPKTVATLINGGASITTAGTYLAAATITFSGLTPSAMYTVSWDCSLLARGITSTSAGFIGARIVHGAGTSDVDHASNTQFLTTYHMQGLSRQGDYTADGSGVITVTPYFRWQSGTTQVPGAYMTASVS